MIEAIVACALIGSVLVPAFAAFRAHISAVSLIEEIIDTGVQAGNIRARLYAEALSPTNAPSPSTVISHEIEITVMEPEYLGIGTPEAYLQRYAVIRPPRMYTTDGFICVFPPSAQNLPAK